MNCPMCHRHMDAWTIAKIVAKFGMAVASVYNAQKNTKPGLPKTPSYKPIDFNKCTVCGRQKERYTGAFKP